MLFIAHEYIVAFVLVELSPLTLYNHINGFMVMYKVTIATWSASCLLHDVDSLGHSELVALMQLS